MKRIFTATAFIFAFVLTTHKSPAQAPEFEWVRTFGGTSIDKGQGLTVDAQGAVYVTGSFRGTVDFDPGPEVAERTAVGSTDIFVQKMDSMGQFVWALTFGSDDYDSGTSIAAVTEQGQIFIYVLGYFSQTVDFDPGPGSAEFTSHGGTDVFLAKYDSEGNLADAWAFGGHAHDYGFDIAIDGEGNIHTTGTFRGIVDFDPGPGTPGLASQLASRGGFDIFVQKLNAEGDLVFATSAGGVGEDYGQAIAVDNWGNVVVTGYFSNTATFGADGEQTSFDTHGDEDVFVWKLDEAGETQWVKTMGSGSRDRGNAIAVDSEGNVYTGGDFSGTVDFDPGPGHAFLTYNGYWDMFVQKLSSDGAFVWARAMLGSMTTELKKLVIDPYGNLFGIGYFGGQAQMGTSSAPATIYAEGYKDIFLVMIHPDGETIWAKSIGDSGRDEGYGLVLDNEGNLYATGFFEGSPDFDPGPYTHTSTSHGAEDIFVLKWNDGFVGTREMAGLHRLEAYPNPTDGRVVIKPGDDVQKGELLIHAMDGRLLGIVQFAGAEELEVVLPYPAGMYTLTILSNNGVSVGKIIKK